MDVPFTKTAWWLDAVRAYCFDTCEAELFSPVRWLEYYREHSAVRLCADSAAFQTCDGKALTHDFMVARTTGLCNLAGLSELGPDGRPVPVKAASWRAGGAMSAVRAGLADPLIMALGRWRSIAWKAYTRFNIEDLEDAARKMWRISDADTPADSPEFSMRVAVPSRFQDDPLDVPALNARVYQR